MAVSSQNAGSRGKRNCLVLNELHPALRQPAFRFALGLYELNQAKSTQLVEVPPDCREPLTIYSRDRLRVMDQLRWRQPAMKGVNESQDR
jgi:hypothetical protein